METLGLVRGSEVTVS